MSLKPVGYGPCVFVVNTFPVLSAHSWCYRFLLLHHLPPFCHPADTHLALAPAGLDHAAIAQLVQRFQPLNIRTGMNPANLDEVRILFVVDSFSPCVRKTACDTDVMMRPCMQ